MSKSREQIITELYERMGAMKRSLHAYTQASLVSCPVSHAQLELLFTIRQLQPVSFKQVAQQLYLTAGAVSQLADPLLEQGFLSRDIDPKDRRIQCLHITKRGEKVLQTIEKRRLASMKRVMESLTTEELAVWARIQQKLITQIHTDSMKDTNNT